MKFWILILIYLCPQFAFARVFDFNDESLAAFFRVSAAMSSVGRDAYGNAGGSGTSFGDEVPYNQSIELGFLLAIKSVVFKFGAEAYQASTITDAAGKNASGTKLMDATSKIFVFNPNLVVEYSINFDSQSRSFVGVGAGYSTVSVDNDFRLTSDGQAAFPSVSDYIEKLDATVISYSLNYGWEYSFIDNVTATIEMGYRYMPFDELEHKADYTTFNGAVTKGDVAINNNGSKRSFDMSGPYVGLAFKFYIGRP